MCVKLQLNLQSNTWERFSISSGVDNDLPLSCPSFLFVENGCTVVVVFFQTSICMPRSHSLTPVTSLSPIPTPTTVTRCTRSSSHDAMLCTPSLCHLFVDCWHVCLCFVSPFSFFMHSTALRRSSASPANSSMFSPPLHTLASLSFRVLHRSSSFSSSFSFCRHIWTGPLVALSSGFLVAWVECLPTPPVCILEHNGLWSNHCPVGLFGVFCCLPI